MTRRSWRCRSCAQALGLDDVILIGHSDGASIALIHAGSRRFPVRALILEAPHVFVEEVSITSIAEARALYDAGDLRQRLARYHADVDSAFRGWNDAWLDPAFRDWTIEEYLAGVTCPVLAIQGEGDEYGTLAQIAAIERGVRGRFAKLVLRHCRHYAASRPGGRGARGDGRLHRAGVTISGPAASAWSRSTSAARLRQHRALVDVALVGDLALVDRGRLVQQQRAGDAMGAAAGGRVVAGERRGERVAPPPFP